MPPKLTAMIVAHAYEITRGLNITGVISALTAHVFPSTTRFELITMWTQVEPEVTTVRCRVTPPGKPPIGWLDGDMARGPEPRQLFTCFRSCLIQLHEPGILCLEVEAGGTTGTLDLPVFYREAR